MTWNESFELIPKSQRGSLCSPCRRLYHRSTPARWWKWLSRDDNDYKVPVPYCTDCKQILEEGRIQEASVSARKKLERQRARRKRNRK